MSHLRRLKQLKVPQDPKYWAQQQGASFGFAHSFDGVKSVSLTPMPKRRTRGLGHQDL